MTSLQRSTALTFLESYHDIDIEANLALRTPDCRHEIVPASMNYPIMDNKQWAAFAASTKSLVEKFPVNAKEIFENEGSNQMTIWATAEAVFRKEATDDESGLDWSFHGEYIFILQFDQMGNRIERIVEFLDSKKTTEAQKLFDRAKRNLAAKGLRSG